MNAELPTATFQKGVPRELVPEREVLSDRIRQLDALMSRGLGVDHSQSTTGHKFP